MGGDISRFIERGEQSRQLTVGAQRAMKKKEKKENWGEEGGPKEKGGTDTVTHDKRLPIDLPLGCRSACAEKKNYNFKELKHILF